MEEFISYSWHQHDSTASFLSILLHIPSVAVLCDAFWRPSACGARAVRLASWTIAEDFHRVISSEKM